MNLLNTNTRSLAMPSRKPTPIERRRVRGIVMPEAPGLYQIGNTRVYWTGRVAIGVHHTTRPEVA